MLAQTLSSQTTFDEIFSKEAELDTLLTLRRPQYIEAQKTVGERELELFMAPFSSDHAQGGVLVVIHDVTEQRRSEQLKREFVANVSHELKTPMTTIAGFADGILDGTIPKDQEDKYLATIADETRRLSRLVRSMLDMSRLESTGEDLTRRREFDISEKIVSTMLSFEARANDKQLDVDLQLPEDSMPVLADPDAITRVLYNLMDNAVKFAAPGSTLCVSLWKSEGKAYVSVRDHGETIPPDDLTFIFDRFHKGLPIEHAAIESIPLETK